MFEERALKVRCGEQCMIAIAHLPNRCCRDGILVVVGGPQYRVGSHRQFVLLARFLAARGIAVLRFDHRGIGDSSGTSRGFQALEKDIRCAVDQFFYLCPKLENMYIWGLCDGASAALMYAHTDARISGLILLNPWVRTEAGLAKAFLRAYYLRRMKNAGFWRDLFAGRQSIWKSFVSFQQNLLRAKAGGRHSKPAFASDPDLVQTREHFLGFMLRGMQNYQGRLLVVIAGEDVTGVEFRELVNSDRQWRRALKGLNPTWIEIKDADHTFSRRDWRTEVERITADWILAP